MKVQIVNHAGVTRELDFVRFEGHDKPAAVVKWGVAGAYRLDLLTNQLTGARSIVVTNWRAADVAELRILHARWLKGRSDKAKPGAAGRAAR